MNLNVIYRAQLQIVLYFFKIDFKNRERSSARNLNADKRHCPLKEAVGAKKHIQATDLPAVILFKISFRPF